MGMTWLNPPFIGGFFVPCLTTYSYSIENNRNQNASLDSSGGHQAGELEP